MNKAPKQAPQKKSPVVPALMIALLVIAAAIGFKAFQSNPKPPPTPMPTNDTVGSAPKLRPASHPAPSREEAGAATEVAPTPVPRTVTPPAQSPPPEFARADARDLVSSLAAVTGKDPLTPEQAQKWKENLQQLVHQGPSSIPAIQQLLTSNVDASFAGIGGTGALGYNSLRSAMLDALAQIGGPESTQAMLQVLQTSIFPTDLGTVAASLNAQAPGQYQQAILDAARQQLNMAALDQLGGANVLPLFQALASEAANGANITGDLAQYAEKWPYYSAIALGSLADGAGVPTLAQLAQGSLPGSQSAAAEALAELAPQNPLALSTLLDLAKSGQLSDSILSQVAPFLSGRQFVLGPPQDASAGGYLTFHMANGNQDFSAYEGAAVLTPPQISQNISIIDQLLQAVPSTDTAAVDALQQQRSILAGKQAH